MQSIGLNNSRLAKRTSVQDRKGLQSQVIPGSKNTSKIDASNISHHHQSFNRVSQNPLQQGASNFSQIDFQARPEIKYQKLDPETILSITKNSSPRTGLYSATNIKSTYPKLQIDLAAEAKSSNTDARVSVGNDKISKDKEKTSPTQKEKPVSRSKIQNSMRMNETENFNPEKRRGINPNFFNLPAKGSEFQNRSLLKAAAPTKVTHSVIEKDTRSQPFKPTLQMQKISPEKVGIRADKSLSSIQKPDLTQKKVVPKESSLKLLLSANAPLRPNPNSYTANNSNFGIRNNQSSLNKLFDHSINYSKVKMSPKGAGMSTITLKENSKPDSSSARRKQIS